MPMYNGNYAAPVWVNGVPPAIGPTELRAMSGTIEKSQILSGSGAPTDATEGDVGQLYVDTSVSPPVIWQMTAQDGEDYLWVTEGDVEKNLAQEYDSTATYEDGDFCINSHGLSWDVSGFENQQIPTTQENPTTADYIVQNGLYAYNKITSGNIEHKYYHISVQNPSVLMAIYIVSANTFRLLYISEEPFTVFYASDRPSSPPYSSITNSQTITVGGTTYYYAIQINIQYGSYTMTYIGIPQFAYTGNDNTDVLTAISHIKKVGTHLYEYDDGSWTSVKAADEVAAHVHDTSNPHEVTAAQVGLGNVENALQYSPANPALRRGTVAFDGTWSGATSPFTKTITVTGPTVTATSHVELQFTPSQMEDLMSRGVRAVHVYNNNGTLTAMAWGGVPGSMTAQCTVEELDSVEIVSFTNGPNEKVGAMIDAAHNGIIDLQSTGGWRVGDRRTITIGPFSDGGSTYYEQQTMTIAISSFEDYNSCGCVMQFDFVESITPTHRMNNSDTNSGGYENTILYSKMLPNMAEALPAWIKNRLITFTVLSSSGNKSTIIDTVENNKLALRSEVEVFGTTTYSAAGEGTQVPYYETESNRVKPLGYNGSANNWWERSPNVTTISDYCRVRSTGEAQSVLASTYSGVSPFGCL